MFKQLSFQDFQTLASQHEKIVVYREILGDQITPISAFLNLGEQKKGAVLLESSPEEKDLGRYSLIGFNSLAEILVKNSQISIKEENNSRTFTHSDPLSIIREYQKKYHATVTHPTSGFSGGLFGFINYEAIRLFENIPNKHAQQNNIPDIVIKFYRDHIIFDHQSGKIVIATLVTTDSNLLSNYENAIQIISNITKEISTPILHNPKNRNHIVEKKPTDPISIDIDDESFKTIINKAKDYIKNGDVFQVVLSRCFQRPFTVEPFEIYRALRLCSPSPYLFYVDDKDYVITGASPEKVVSIRNKMIEIVPLAGTRPRGKNSEEDNTLANELMNDEKETAEHMMLVDLARNDVGRVAEPGSVKVHELKKVKKFSKVMHLSSSVRGDLHSDKDAFDALIAGFPAGTLSGAPKIRAMEIINELDHSPRAVYGGAIFFIDSHQNLESCIAIRMAVLKDNIATVRAGAGIVFDSVPQQEADETYQKAKSVLHAIAVAEGEYS